VPGTPKNSTSDDPSGRFRVNHTINRFPDDVNPSAMTAHKALHDPSDFMRME
jgi:hypothetical protein